MIKYSIYREHILILGEITGEFINTHELVVHNRHSGRDFSQVIQPGDTVVWADADGTKHNEILRKVSPLIESKQPYIGRGAKLELEGDALQ